MSILDWFTRKNKTPETAAGVAAGHTLKTKVTAGAPGAPANRTKSKQSPGATPPRSVVPAAAAEPPDKRRADLIQALGDRTPGAREQAEQELKQLGLPGLEALVWALGDEAYDVQFGAMTALSRLGATVIDPLIRALGDLEPQAYDSRESLVQRNAARLLGRLGDDRAIGPLLRAAGFRAVGGSALRALAEIGGVDLLARALQNADDNRASETVWALRRWGDQRSRDIVAEWCRKVTKPALLLPAGMVLADFGDERAVDPLMRLYHGDYRGMVTESLARLTSDVAVEPLIRILKESGSTGSYHDHPRCEFAARALGQLRDSRAVEPLIGALSSYNWPGIKVAAARSLGRLGHTSAIDPLTKALDHKDDSVRAAAGWALMLLGDARGTARLLEDIDKGSFPAAESLAELGDARGEEALIRTVENNALDCRAVLALARLGTKRCVDELLNVFEHIKDDSEKLQCVEFLGDSGDPRAVDVLIRYTQKVGWWRVMPAVFRALSLLGDPRSAAVLITGLRFETGKTGGDDRGGADSRWAAVSALGRLGDPRDVETLIPELSSWRKEERWAAIDALARLRDLRGIDPLIQMLEDIDGEIRAKAALALGEMGAMQAIDPLIQMLKEKRKWTLLSAIDALGELGIQAAIEPLTRMLSGSDPDVSDRASKVIQRLRSPKQELIAALIQDDGPSSEGLDSDNRQSGASFLPDDTRSMTGEPRDTSAPAVVEKTPYICDICAAGGLVP